MSRKKKEDSVDVTAQLVNLISNPIDIGGEGCEYWNNCAAAFKDKATKLLKENGLAGDVDSFLLDSLVRSYRRIIELSHETLAGGMVIDSPHGKKANPALASLQSEERIFYSYLTGFGLTPRSRNSIDGAVSTKPLHGNHSQSNILKILNN